MIKPMLAQVYDSSKFTIKLHDNVMVQPKLDGIRCIFTKHGAYSRAGNKFMNLAHLELKLIPFFKKNPEIILDGELYNHKLKDNFEKIVSLVKKQKPTADDRLDAQHLIQYYVYDVIPAKPSLNEVHIKRHNFLCKEFKKKKYAKIIQVTPTYPVLNAEEARTYHHAFLAEGYEGSIIRANQLYKNKRSPHLLKVKDFSDTEATIIGYEEGKGKRQGTLGKFLMIDDEGVEFGCPPGKGYTYKDLSNILLNIHYYIGKRATFTYFQKTKKGSYRHPLFKSLRNYE
jgi:DNA ligase-1